MVRSSKNLISTVTPYRLRIKVLSFSVIPPPSRFYFSLFCVNFMQMTKPFSPFQENHGTFNKPHPSVKHLG